MADRGYLWDAQYRYLSDQECSNNATRGGLLGGTFPVRVRFHGLQEVSAWPIRRLFRKTYYWRCHFCDLRVRSVRGFPID